MFSSDMDDKKVNFWLYYWKIRKNRCLCICRFKRDYSIMITGVAGFIGANLCIRLIAASAVQGWLYKTT